MGSQKVFLPININIFAKYNSKKKIWRMNKVSMNKKLKLPKPGNWNSLKTGSTSKWNVLSGGSKKLLTKKSFISDPLFSQI